MPLKPYFIGLMSGTSLDGTDGVLVSFGLEATDLRVHAHVHRPFPPELQDELLRLNKAGDNELHRAALCANDLSSLYSEVVTALLDTSGVTRDQVQAVGCHGQTIRHRPREFDGVGYTVQLNNPARLAELCGIDIVADFRSRDVAAGGQGAPLVPAFHRAFFGRNGQAVAVVNVGGMSNLTVIAQDGQTSGFDCGPGNVLLDHWCRQHTGQAFDRDGSWAASGQPVLALLHQMLAEPYFELPPPKSTGRDLFSAAWLSTHLQAWPSIAAQDVQATLAELTATCCAQAIERHAPAGRQVLICGGGAFNADLLARLSGQLRTPVSSTELMGLPPHQVESAAFAWLAQACVTRQSANLVTATGARGPRVLGAIYPA